MAPTLYFSVNTRSNAIDDKFWDVDIFFRLGHLWLLDLVIGGSTGLLAAAFLKDAVA